MKRRHVLACVFLALAVVSGTWSARHMPPVPERSLAERLLGPIATLGAAAQWVRADAAWAAGRIDLYDARAEFALRLAPSDPNGYVYYAHHLIYDRASPRLELDPAAREHWVREGLAILERGERSCRSPGRLAFQRAIVFLALAQMDDGLRPFRITSAQAWASAAEAFDRAALLGEPLAAEAASAARLEARDAK